MVKNVKLENTSVKLVMVDFNDGLPILLLSDSVTKSRVIYTLTPEESKQLGEALIEASKYEAIMKRT